MDGIVVFLNGERGIQVVEEIVSSNHVIKAVVIKSRLSTVDQDRLDQWGLTSLQIEEVNQRNSIDVLKALKPKLFIVAGFSQIFKSELLKIPELGTVNLHAGKLPKYRGGSPLNWQLINGESSAGISVLKMTEGIDSGEILEKANFPIKERDNIENLHQEANRLFPKLVIQVLNNFEDGKFHGEAQIESDACYWHQRNDVDGRIDFTKMQAGQVIKMIRALTKPYPGAWSTYKNQTVRFLEASIPTFLIRGTPGRICYIQGQGPIVICQDQGILIEDYHCPTNPALKLQHGTHISD